MRTFVATLAVIALLFGAGSASILAEAQESQLLGVQVTYDTWSYTVASALTR
jgi:hypothetical protein